MKQSEKRELKSKVREAIMEAFEAGAVDEFIEAKGLVVEDLALADAGVVLEILGEHVAIDPVVKAKSFDLADSIEVLADKEQKEQERIAKKMEKLAKLKAKAEAEAKEKEEKGE